MPDRINLQTELRAAAVQLLTDYVDDAGLSMFVWPARQMTNVQAPSAFVNGMRERQTDYAGATRKRIAQCDVAVLHGLFDSADAATQRDAFVDGFSNWVADRYHAAGPNTLIEVVSLSDEPTFRVDWVPQQQQRTYYATVITLEAFAGT